MVKEKYENEGAIQGPHQPVEFESEAIKLDIAKEGITCDNGWKIIPLVSPTVSFTTFYAQSYVSARTKTLDVYCFWLMNMYLLQNHSPGTGTISTFAIIASL